ncbi:MAG TPA: SDR family oxidoreductase [Steroidobacteraceae bacterium]|nr:SDR family oxidoreductase [Steroidobacteraceae bacterium]
MDHKVKRLKPAAEPRQWGMNDEELATRPTVFRPDLLRDKVFVVSGGGTGIGRGITYLLARLGADVMICGRRAEKLEETASGIQRLVGREIATCPMTIREPDQVDTLIARTYDRFGRLDTLVNNSGGQFPQAAIDFSVKGWNAVIDTNLNGTWYMMQAAARHWRDRGQGGNIVNIVATIARGMPQVAHTCAARAGVIYLSKTVATEWAPLNIRVNCIAPGSIATEGFNVYPDGVPERFALTNPLKRLGEVHDVAEAVVYVAADSGKFITGEVLTVDGGHSVWGDTEWPGGRPPYFDIT